jgi:hypothetical protein
MRKTLEQTRQESIRVWADAQRRALHEAVKNTSVNNQPAAAASGSVAGGSFGGSPTLDMDAVLQLLNAGYSTITDVVESGRLFYFTDEPDPDGEGGFIYNIINDGGSDMYDGANYFNTNLTQPWEVIDQDDANYSLNIPYTHTQDVTDFTPYLNPPMDGQVADGTDYFGLGSKYFTNMYPGLFVLAADGISIEQFSIGGNIGTDGDADIETQVIEAGNGAWTLFTKTNTDTDGDDPIITHLILVRGGETGLTHLTDTTGRYDDDGVFGLSGRATIFCLVMGTEWDQGPMQLPQLAQIATAFLNVINQA